MPGAEHGSRLRPSVVDSGTAGRRLSGNRCVQPVRLRQSAEEDRHCEEFGLPEIQRGWIREGIGDDCSVSSDCGKSEEPMMPATVDKICYVLVIATICIALVFVSASNAVAAYVLPALLAGLGGVIYVLRRRFGRDAQALHVAAECGDQD